MTHGALIWCEITLIWFFLSFNKLFLLVQVSCPQIKCVDVDLLNMALNVVKPFCLIIIYSLLDEMCLNKERTKSLCSVSLIFVNKNSSLKHNF